jgi:hypothetical protein
VIIHDALQAFTMFLSLPRARRQVVYQEDILGINAPSKKVLKKEV